MEESTSDMNTATESVVVDSGDAVPPPAYEPRRIGSPVTEHGDGALIQNVAPKAPADGKLRAGDVITALNGKPVHVKTELLALLAPHKFGETIAVSVTTQGQPARTENIKLGG